MSISYFSNFRINEEPVHPEQVAQFLCATRLRHRRMSLWLRRANGRPLSRWLVVRRELLNGWKFILLALAFTCSSARSIPQESSDTLIVENPAMVFYRLSGSEYDSLITRMTFRLDSLSLKFADTFEKISPFLKKRQIEPIITSAKTIVFPKAKYFCFTRQKEKELFGVIFYIPAKTPEVFPGVFTDVELLNRMNAYYYSSQERNK